MKKITLIFAIAFLGFAGTSFAQSQWDGKGTKNLDLGIGLGNGYWGGLPIRASYDIGYNENISIGGYAAFIGGKQTGLKSTNILIGARGAYHYPLVDKLDTYGGLFVGGYYYSFKYDEIIVGGIDFTPKNITGFKARAAFFVGARYMFTDKIGAFAEIGAGVSLLQLGVTIKM